MIFNDSPTAQWNFQLLLNYWILSTDPKKSFNLYFEYFSWFMLNRSFNRCQNCFRVRLSALNINFFIENMITFVNCRRGGPKTIARYEVDYIQKSKTIKGSFKNCFFSFEIVFILESNVQGFFVNCQLLIENVQIDVYYYLIIIICLLFKLQQQTSSAF